MKAQGLIKTKYQYWLLALPYSTYWVFLITGINLIYSRNQILGIRLIVSRLFPFMLSYILLENLFDINSINIISYIFFTFFSLVLIKFQESNLSFNENGEIGQSATQDITKRPFIYWFISGAIGLILLTIPGVLTINWILLGISLFLLLSAVRIFLKEKQWVYLIMIGMMIVAFSFLAIS